VTVTAEDAEVLQGLLGRADAAYSVIARRTCARRSSIARNVCRRRDIAMTGDEVMPVQTFMRAHGRFVGCVYNQEAEEQPRLYFTYFLRSATPTNSSASFAKRLPSPT
jgi:hypothetical protein